MARRGSVYLYVPNIIGYVRIALAVVAFANYWDYARFTALYLAGFLLDAADGYAARLLNQQSDFGAALDMLTDRLCTGALLTLLSHLYQPFAPVFLGLIVLDGYSHWLQMAACVCGRGAWGRGREREGTSGLRGRQRRAAGGWRAAAVVERGGGGVGGNGGRPGRVCYMRIAPRPTQLRWV